MNQLPVVTIDFEKGVIRFRLSLNTEKLVYDKWYCDYGVIFPSSWGNWFKFNE